MIDQQFVDYIRRQLAAGVAREDIKKALRINGLSEQDMAEGFAAVGTAPSAPSAGPITPPQSVPETRTMSAPFVQTVTVPAQTASRPGNVTFFELLMYASIALSVASTLGYLYFGFVLSLVTPLSLAVGRSVLVFFAAHKKGDWARIVLLALFFTHALPLIQIVSSVISNPAVIFSFGILSYLAPIVLEAAALGFVFSPSANRWFEPANYMPGSSLGVGAEKAAGSLGAGIENTTWTKTIPRMNKIFMVLSLLLVFVLDLAIVIAERDLIAFWAVMLVVLGIFGIFFHRENYLLSKRFANSHSTLDKWIAAVVVIRNIVFVLNFIPFIQLLGGAILVYAGIPYVILYSILLSKRSKAIQTQ